MGEVISVLLVPVSPQQNPAMENMKKQNEDMRKREEELKEKEKELARRERVKIQREEEVRRREEEVKKRERILKEEEVTRREQTVKMKEEVLNKALEDDERRRAEETRRREQELKQLKDLLAEMTQQVESVKKALSVITGKQEVIRSQKRPGAEEIEAIRKARQYKDGYYHFAIAGMTGCGKSSLINAFRGMRDNEPNSAKTGTVETTREITRYTDQSWFTRGRFVWYDIPGCGTLDTSGEEYFNTQGLYIFDAIIVVVDARFSQSDIAIIRNCIEWDIPWYLVRSKADQQIENLVEDFRERTEGRNEAFDETRGRNEAREKHIADTRQQFKNILAEAVLPPQDVYIVSSSKLRMCFKNRAEQKGSIDEWKLIKDLIRDVFERRVVKAAGSTS